MTRSGLLCLALAAAVVIVLGFAIARPAEAIMENRTPTTVATAGPVIGWTLAGAPSGLLGRLVGVRSGLSTWYCCTRNYSSSAYIGAAGAPLRVGNWRGRHVRVCRADRPSACVYVALRDFCACRPGVVIDLQPGAFRQLAPLSRGVVRVRVTW